jgi:U3 small nucleolar RNA-associated protein 18
MDKKKEVSPLTASLSTRETQKSRKRVRSSKEEQDAAEERRLTALLFGGGVEEETQQQSEPEESESEEQENTHEISESFFELDRTGDGELQVEAEEARQDEYSDDDEDHVAVEKPAWVDEDDADVSMSLMSVDRLKKLRKSRSETAPLDGIGLERRLRKRFQETTTARTDWANVDEAAEKKEKDSLLESSDTPLLASSSGRLPPHVLNVVRCPDANQQDPNKAVVQAVHFHPGSDPDRPLMLTAGLDKTLRFFQVDAEESQKIHGIHFPKLPIYSASFLGDTGNVVVSGRRPFFYIYDAVAGKLDMVPKIMGRQEKSLEKFAVSPDGRTIAFIGNDGYIILVDVHSKQWIADLKMNGSARAVTFTPDGEEILGSGSDGDVYRWNLQSRRCLERFSNEDGTITSSLSASFKNLAVGAESGVVNLYSSPASHHQKLKSIMNMHTSADYTKFNHDGQILAFSSRREKHSMKLLHVPTATVFSNWPTSKTPLNYVWSMDFSPQSKFLAVGNDKGNCLLYKLNHYHKND